MECAYPASSITLPNKVQAQKNRSMLRSIFAVPVANDVAIAFGIERPDKMLINTTAIRQLKNGGCPLNARTIMNPNPRITATRLNATIIIPLSKNNPFSYLWGRNVSRPTNVLTVNFLLICCRIMRRKNIYDIVFF